MAALLMLAFLAISPVVEAEVFAEEDAAARAATASTVTIGFTPQSANASMTPVDAGGAKAKVDVKATVRVQNSGGYSVYVGSSSSDLQNGVNTIPSVTSATTYANMPVNRWGYSFAKGAAVSDSYSAMPATLRGTALDSNSSANITDETRTYMLSFAANIGADKPTGTYKNQVTMSVLSSPLAVAEEIAYDFGGITTMQEMTAAICSAAPTGGVKQLKDTRDGKYYWVGKMKDGKCWMTQNLDLDLNASTLPLTSATSDVSSNWTPGDAGKNPAHTETTASSDTIYANITGQRSWSLGDYSIINPTDSTSCGSKLASAAGCVGSGTKDRFQYYQTPTTANGDMNAHYILGNHYQWNAATAGTGGSITSGQATSSICPKGWRLPTSTDSGEFKALIDAYAIGTDVAKLTSSPLYFVRGGDVTQDTDILFDAPGYRGHYWSSTPSSSTSNHAYYLYFLGATTISPSNSYNRYTGRSVRCAARDAEPVTYSVAYDHNSSTGTLPAKQEAQSTSDSYTFTAPEKPSGLSHWNCFNYNFLGWSTTQMPLSSTPEYPAGTSITLTREHPAITLYPVWKSAGACVN